MGLRILGDVHGKFEQYRAIACAAEYSVQLGDFGWRDSYIKLINSDLDSNKHKLIRGNHDDADYIEEHGLYNDLGDFGSTTLGGVEFFFVRGAFSIDKELRQRYYYQTRVKSWFEQEELSVKDLNEAINDYKKLKPEIVITHCPPQDIANKMGNPEVLAYFGYSSERLLTRTGMALQAMFDDWQPKFWYFGHMHKSWRQKICGTQFVGLAELECVDI